MSPRPITDLFFFELAIHHPSYNIFASMAWQVQSICHLHVCLEGQLQWLLLMSIEPAAL